ncbi:hypothetical protein BDV06DRAFT_229114 [Aspergillus oleicola]
MLPNYHRPQVSNCWEYPFIIGGYSFRDKDRREKLEKLKGNGKDQNLMTDKDLLICYPTVRCFSFNKKMFLECAVGDLGDVQWSPASFDRLQIPEDTKQILVSVTTSCLSSNRDVVFNDFIKGKG